MDLSAIYLPAIIVFLEITNRGYSATVQDVSNLHTNLFSNYSRVIPPVYQQNHAIHVQLSLFLLMIHDLDMKNQVLTTSGWLNVNWDDEFLRWNRSDYGGVEEITVSQSQVWLPDILVENTAQNFAEIGSDSILVSIKNNGQISWEPGILTKTICEVNIGKYPFDYQKCEIKFLTWMHTNKTLDVTPGSDVVGLDACIPNGEWDIQTAIARPYFYPSTYKPGTAHTGVKFVIELVRKRTFYVLNTIIPVVMLSFLNVLVFLLPASSGEKMALAVTVLLSFTVYLSIISEVMPKTSESISILAVYLTTLLSLSTMSVLSAGIVMNMVNQDPEKPVPPFLRSLVCWRTRQARRERRQESLRRKVNGSTARSSRKHDREKEKFNFTYLQNDINRHDPMSSSSGDPWQRETQHQQQHQQHHHEHHTDENSIRKSRHHVVNSRDVSSEGLRVFPMHEYNYRNDVHNDGMLQDSDTMLHSDEDPRAGETRHLQENHHHHHQHYQREHYQRHYSDGGDTSISSSFTPNVSWNDVGSAVDTLLFWVFLGITVASTSTVFILFSYQ